MSNFDSIRLNLFIPHDLRWSIAYRQQETKKKIPARFGWVIDRKNIKSERHLNTIYINFIQILRDIVLRSPKLCSWRQELTHNRITSHIERLFAAVSLYLCTTNLTIETHRERISHNLSLIHNNNNNKNHTVRRNELIFQCSRVCLCV